MTDKKPLILIQLCTKMGDDMYYIRRGYVEALAEAGALPVTLPLMCDKDYAERMIDMADGLLLPGSITDVDPGLYHTEMSPFFGQRGPERDKSDFYILEQAFDRKLPVFGICYGHQMLNVFCGGSLYQDIPHDLNSDIVHWQPEPYHLPAHNVSLEEESIVWRIFGRKNLSVNSIHHQGVKTVASMLRPTAYSPDGIIEAYENKNGNHFLMGVQWHPERMWEYEPSQLALFKEFIDATRDWRRQNR